METLPEVHEKDAELVLFMEGEDLDAFINDISTKDMPFIKHKVVKWLDTKENKTIYGIDSTMPSKEVVHLAWGTRPVMTDSPVVASRIITALNKTIKKDGNSS